MTRPTRSELLPVLALVAIAVLDGLANPAERPAAVVVVTGVLTALVLLGRRRHAVAVPLLVGLLIAGRALAGAVPDQTTSTLPLLILATFSAAVHAPRLRDGLLAGVACLAGTLFGVSATTSEPVGPADLVIVSVLILVAAGSGTVVRRRTTESRLLLEAGEAAERERDRQARAAVTEERARIARELHDVLAHSVSIISVQAGAAERQALRDPARARAAVAQVRRTAEEAQNDLVRLLDVLRGRDAIPASRQPGLPELERLVAEAREAGHPVALELDPALAGLLPEGVALAAYRIVQESLTNVRKHAGAVPTDVRLLAQGAGLLVEVVNLPGPGRGGGSGLGLVGMDERVRVHGGDLRAGPDAAGRWAVEAILPLGAPA